MKTPPLHIIIAVCVLLTGCATTSKRPLSFTVPPNPSDTPPKKNDYLTAYSYAQGRMTATDYPEAAVNFGRAAEWVPAPGTEDRVWEFECYLNAAWASILAGDKAGAKSWLDKAKSLDVQAAPSDRARYLDSLLSGDVQAALPPNLKNTLP